MPAIEAVLVRPPALLGLATRCAVSVLAAVLAALFASLLSFGTHAQPAPPTADEVKAAYLQKLPGYVTWPDSAFSNAASPIVIGVLGSETVYAELVKLAAGREIHGRNVVVAKLSHVDQEVHVLFVGKDAAEGLADALAGVARRPVLTVTDMDGGMERGAALNFVSIAGRIRFEVSLVNVERAGVKLSSRLLTVAERVVGSPP